MGKYIDVEAFREEMDNHFPFDKYTQDHEPLLDLAKSRIIRLLAKFPSADVEPVRHSAWKEVLVGLDYEYECTRCKACVEQEYPYCPNCGAKMGGEGQEHDN